MGQRWSQRVSQWEVLTEACSSCAFPLDTVLVRLINPWLQAPHAFPLVYAQLIRLGFRPPPRYSFSFTQQPWGCAVCLFSPLRQRQEPLNTGFWTLMLYQLKAIKISAWKRKLGNPSQLWKSTHFHKYFIEIVIFREMPNFCQINLKRNIFTFKHIALFGLKIKTFSKIILFM